jgi:dTDP-4-amino-4,6-dideoxygalactose transaminase
MNAHQVTRDFEQAVAEYTGAPFCVAVNSCTSALLLAVAWATRHHRSLEVGTPVVEIPKRTYVGVPMSIIHAGCDVTFRDEDWGKHGCYRLDPLPVWDCARLFTSRMYCGMEDDLLCVSFHATKTLGIEQGGAILLNDPEADVWLRRMRFDGRTAGIPVQQDRIREIGWHCYMNPSTAAQGLMRMAGLPKHNDPLPMSDYPDLSEMEVFQ